MFIGSLVLFFSALFIIVFTSLPVINKIINTNFTIGEDREFFYNRIQIFVAILLGILTAVTQYLKYRNTEKKYLIEKSVSQLWLAVAHRNLHQLFWEISNMILMALDFSPLFTWRYLQQFMP